MFFFKQKTAYEMRISDWSSDVCSSDLGEDLAGQAQTGTGKSAAFLLATMNHLLTHPRAEGDDPNQPRAFILAPTRELAVQIHNDAMGLGAQSGLRMRSEEHTSELQSLMRISYAVFCLKKKKTE